MALDEAPDTDEIAVTPEMIKAGALELARFNPDYQSLEDGALRIYQEMLRAATETDPPLTAVDRWVIESWERQGYVIPAPELSRETLDRFCRSLLQIGH
jgi:hypothetical protein